MEAFKISTWNVLHRVHAQQASERCAMTLERYPKEAARVIDIAAHVEHQFAQGSRVVCLQEVSADQLHAIRERLGARVTIFDHQLARIPETTLDCPPKARLMDNAEYLAILTDFPAPKAIIGASFSSAGGKGVLGVQVQDNTAVFNCHISSGKIGERQIREELMMQHILPYLKKNRQNQAVLAGSFGRTLERVFGCVGELAYCTGEDLSGFTKQGKHTCGDKDVDHVIGLGGTDIGEAILFPNANLSIHQPLQCVVMARINSTALRAAGTRSGFREYPAGSVSR